jgi:hypothetical protein
MTATTETAILSRVIEPEAPTMSDDAARSLLALDFAAADRDRMNHLAAKARAGTLTTAENEELDNYIQVGHLLALLKSKARRSLRDLDAA